MELCKAVEFRFLVVIYKIQYTALKKESFKIPH